jgi:hypothetical protein
VRSGQIAIDKRDTRIAGFAFAHSTSEAHKKAQPPLAGLGGVVVAVQDTATIRSRRLQKFAQRPGTGRKPGFHRGRHAELHVNPAEVVPREMQAVCGPEILPLLAEGIRKACQTAHLHSDSQVLPLDVRRANLRGIGITHDWDLLRVDHIGRTVPPLAFGILGVHLDELREVATVAQRRRDRTIVGLEAISADLEALRRSRCPQPFDEGVRRRLTAAPNAKLRTNFE